MKFASIALIFGVVSAIRLQDDKEEVDHSKEFFEASQDHQFFGKLEYIRVPPAYFTDEGDDLFMKSMIMTYALEGKNKDGTPNNKFWMNEAQTRAAAAEVLDNNKHMERSARESWINTYFERTWAHFDVNKTGMVEVQVMPQLMRFLASDQQLQL